MKYRKKPETVEAIQWNGENSAGVEAFLKLGLGSYAGFVKGRYVDIGAPGGLQVASPGDYIIKDERGNFFPCKPELFELLYEVEP